MYRSALAAFVVVAAGCTVPVETRPVARAGLDRLVPAGDTVLLAAEADREFDFSSWTVVSAPGRHVLLDGTSARPSFTAAEPGTYVLALEVFSGSARSEPDYVQVTALACDEDGDGSRRPGRVCRGYDCDDTDPARSPSKDDVCEDGIDQDCDGEDDPCCPRDQDGDGHVTALCPGGDDCNDTIAGVHPGAFDVCNGVDEDCNGVDDGRDCPPDRPCELGVCGCVPKLEKCDDLEDQDCDGADLQSDGDYDRHAKPECGGDDCDDLNDAVHPGATEICANGIDEDCDGEDLPFDADGDGHGLRASPLDPTVSCPGGDDCNDGDPNIYPGAPDLCTDGIDQNCDGRDAIPDADFDGFVATACGGRDCDDTDHAVRPTAVETCNGIDDDCNGAVDDLPPIACGPALGAFPLQLDGAVGNWLVLGPQRTARTCWDEAVRLPGGDGAADPGPGDGAFGLRWQRYDFGGAVDLWRFGGANRPDARYVAYLFTKLVVPAPAHYQLRLEASESAELWLDGRLQPFPATSLACNGAAAETATVYLSAGVHRVLVRTGTDGGTWTVKLRAFTPQTTAPGPDRTAAELRVDTGVGSAFGSCRPGTLACDPVTGETICLDYVGPSPESCETFADDDCDGVGYEPDEDADGLPAPGCELEGYAGPPDCDDRHRQVGPGRPELCDAWGVDESCDGVANDLPPATCGSGPTTFLREDGAVPEWLVFGPIDTPGLETRAALDRRDLSALLGGAPEAIVRAYPGQVVGPFAWTPVSVPADRTGGWVDLAEALPGRDLDRTTTLALATLWIPEEADYRLDVIAGGALQVLLDGVAIREVGQTDRQVSIYDSRRWSAGPHRLLVKVTSLLSTSPGFGARLTRPGRPATVVGLDLGRGVQRGACVQGVRTCGPDGWSTCVGGFSAVPEKCNGLDDDCDGVLPADEVDADGDGAWGCDGDCDGGRADVGPGAVEVCDGRDNDCDGGVDAGPGGAPLGGEVLCGFADAVCEPYRTGCPGSLARCTVVTPCADDESCVVRYGTGWWCGGGDRCLRCGAR